MQKLSPSGDRLVQIGKNGQETAETTPADVAYDEALGDSGHLIAQAQAHLWSAASEEERQEAASLARAIVGLGCDEEGDQQVHIMGLVATLLIGEHEIEQTAELASDSSDRPATGQETAP